MRQLGAILLATVLQVSAFAQQTPGDPNTASQIREQSERYLGAIERSDVKTLDDLLIDECLVFYPRGVVDTKPTLLEALRERGPAETENQADHTLSDVTVRCVGETAVLTATLTIQRGDAASTSHRRTLTWARQGDHWRLVHDQWSLVGDASESEYWSGYFRGDNQNFKRKPNALLAEVIEKLPPGKALDVGVGEGRNAICLAKRGWKVTGIDRAEGALAVARQRASEQGVKITPVLQSAEEFDWGQKQWDLIALLYVPAVRGNVAKVREALKPGGLVVVEAFVVPPEKPGRGVNYVPGELRKMFEEGFAILRYEETEGVADYGQERTQLVRLVGRRTTTQSPAHPQASQPAAAPSSGHRAPARRFRRGR